MRMKNFERKYSPGYRHMICIVKTKSTSEKGLLRKVLIYGNTTSQVIIADEPVQYIATQLRNKK